jgi:hypothetical protein
MLHGKATLGRVRCVAGRAHHPPLSYIVLSTCPGRFRLQYFVTRTGVTQVDLSQYGPIPRWTRPAHLQLRLQAVLQEVDLILRAQGERPAACSVTANRYSAGGD